LNYRIFHKEYIFLTLLSSKPPETSIKNALELGNLLLKLVYHGKISNEAPGSKLRRIGAKLRRSQPVFALKSFDAVRLAIHPCSKLQGILAKTNKKRG
jgi:hypothetical protein